MEIEKHKAYPAEWVRRKFVHGSSKVNATDVEIVQRPKNGRIIVWLVVNNANRR
jgi:hypothetical protein